MIGCCGAAQSCVRNRNAEHFVPSSRLDCATPCEFIIQNPGFSAGGITGCWRFQKIAGCALMKSWRAKAWRRVVLRPESIVKCAKEKKLPTTRQSGPNFRASEFLQLP